MMAYLHPDLILCLAMVFASGALLQIYRINDSRNKINKVAPIGMVLFFVASVLNYIEETPLAFLMLAFFNEQEWDTIIPLFGYGPGGVLLSHAFFDWYRALNKLQNEVEYRREAEEKLEEALILAKDANQAKSQFLASVSHELRTPLSAILGFSEMITREQFGKIGNEKYLEYGEIIHRSGEHLLQIVNDLIDLARVEANKISLVQTQFSVDDLITDCVHIVRHTAKEKSITLDTALYKGLTLYADRRLVKQMLLNLLSNSLKFTKEGGTITIGSLQEGNRIKLFVEDTGIGMSSEDIVYALEAFSQVENSFYPENDGLGLGLPLVKRFIAAHGGYLDISSHVNKGTTVTLSFRVVQSVHG